MKKYFLGIAIAVMALVIACVKDLEDEGIYNTTKYMGVVVEKTTMQPIPGIMVQVTDGTHVHASTETDNNGKFVLKEINFEEVDTNYYLWLDGTPRDLPSKQERLMGLGNKIYDYKTLVLYDKTNADLLPTVTTNSITEVTALSAKVNCAVTRNGAREVTVRGVCYSPYQMPTIGNPVVTAGRSTGSYTCPLTRLNKNTTYYVRAYATNSIGTVYGAQMMFRTKDGNATITTTDATEIASNSALVGGNITNDGGAAITARGICWAKTANPTISGDHTSDGTGTGSFTHRLQQLDNSTTYYYRPYATNACGTSYGPQKTFVTTSGKPTVTTSDASNITATTATCGGNVTDNGGFNVTARGVCWNTVGNPDVSGSHTSNGNGNGSFTSNMTGLTPGTLYHVRAYATNSMGTSYGSERTFTTSGGSVAITISTPTNITATSASCSANITNDGGAAITERGICWSTTQSPTVSGTHRAVGTGTGSYSATMTGLAPGTTYYVRAYATNAVRTTYSSQVSFRTNNGLPTVTTTAVTKSGNNIVSGGNVTSDGGFAVTARGICYGQYPNPDLTSNYTHTSDGTGTGYYTSVIGVRTGTIYVRAYATNANGTAYGNEMTVNLDYIALPTFVYNGHTYRVAPCVPNVYSWSDANAYASATLYGYSDWRLPTIQELQQMYILRNTIGGFDTARDMYERCYYWSSTRDTTINGVGYFRYVWFVNGSVGIVPINRYCYNYRAIRRED